MTGINVLFSTCCICQSIHVYSIYKSESCQLDQQLYYSMTESLVLPSRYLNGKSDVQLAHSLNGVYWKRTDRTPMIPNGAPGSLDAGLIYPSSVHRTPPLHAGTATGTAATTGDPRGEKIIITASASALEHGVFSYANGTGSGALLSYELRKDGWAYLESSGGVGIVGTRILWLSHGEITVNLNAKTGSVLCRVTDQHNVPMPGFDWDEAVPCEACDTLAWAPQWRQQGGGPSHNLSSLAGQGSRSVIRLEFQMVNARLYSLEGHFAPISDAEARGSFPPHPRPGFEPGWW
jgi:hypothetical protein